MDRERGTQGAVRVHHDLDSNGYSQVVNYFQNTDTDINIVMIGLPSFDAYIGGGPPTDPCSAAVDQQQQVPRTPGNSTTAPAPPRPTRLPPPTPTWPTIPRSAPIPPPCPAPPESSTKTLYVLLTEQQKSLLDGLLEVTEGQQHSTLDTSPRPPTRVPGPAMIGALQRAAEILGLGFGEMDASAVPPRRLAGLSRYGMEGKAARPVGELLARPRDVSCPRLCRCLLS
jgi:hypothetical protein